MSEDFLHIENVYAYNEDHKIIYIGDVPSHENGIKKGYYCLDCQRRMQAVKGNIRKQHFKHHVKPHSTEKKCTYRDETYRHKLAKDLIQIVGKIKVPAVYKFDPTKKSNQALLIRESRFIDIEDVLIERYIYENQNGEIEIIHKEDNSKNLLIKPDAIVLNKDKKPILIVEFVATHKPNIDKLIKFKRLGIDAIQVSIPKSSPEEIEKCFSITQQTKWLFNNEESETNYLQFSEQYSGAIFEVDEEQRKLFEEGFKCRSAEIGDLIRTIERLLQKEHYQTIERNLRSEIQRVERNTSAARERLEDIREGYIREGIEKHRGRREKLINSTEKFSKYQAGLEERYLKKRRELELEETAINQSIAELEFSIQKINLTRPTTSSDVEAARETSETIRREIEVLESRERKNSELAREIFERTRDEIKSETERIEAQIDSLSEYFGRENEKSEIDFDKLRNAEEQEIQRIEIEQKRITNSIRTESTDIQSRIESNNKGVFQELEKGSDSSIGRITEEYRGIHNFRESIIEYKKALEILERIEAFIRKKS